MVRARFGVFFDQQFVEQLRDVAIALFEDIVAVKAAEGGEARYRCAPAASTSALVNVRAKLFARGAVVIREADPGHARAAFAA